MLYVMVFITVPEKKEAEKIVSRLLDKHLIACANLIKNIDSHFWWQGNKTRAKEVLLIVKTSRSLFNKLIKTVKTIHSYDIPEIIAVPIVSGYKPYFEWIKEVINKKGRRKKLD